jgi:low affinity Fe/Cu permease
MHRLAFGTRQPIPGTAKNRPAFHIMIHYRPWLTQIGVSTSHPLAFAVVAVYVAAWIIFDPASFGWQSTATVATWVMTLFIQRAEHRDTQAIHAKLDELLRAHGDADEHLAKLDREEPEEIKRQRDRAMR